MSEGNEIRSGGVVQIVKIKFGFEALCVAVQERRVVSCTSGRRGLKALGDLRQVRFRSDLRERSRPRSCDPPEGARMLATQTGATRSTMFSKAATGLS